MKHKSILFVIGAAALLGALAVATPSKDAPFAPDQGDAFELHMLTVQIEGSPGTLQQDQLESFLVDEVNGRTWYHSKIQNAWRPILFPGGASQPPPASRGWRISQGQYPGVTITGFLLPYLVSASTGRTYILSGQGNDHGETYHWLEIIEGSP